MLVQLLVALKIKKNKGKFQKDEKKLGMVLYPIYNPMFTWILFQQSFVLSSFWSVALRIPQKLLLAWVKRGKMIPWVDGCAHKRFNNQSAAIKFKLFAGSYGARSCLNNDLNDIFRP